MSSNRVRSQQPQNQAGRLGAGPSLSHRLDPSEGIEMERIHHRDLGLGGSPGASSPPSSSSRQAWSRDNPGFEPEEEMLDADWPPASPGRRSVSTASSSSSSGSSGLGSFNGGSSSSGGGAARMHRGLYPTPAPEGQHQDTHGHRDCGKRILEKIRSKCVGDYVNPQAKSTRDPSNATSVYTVQLCNFKNVLLDVADV